MPNERLNTIRLAKNSVDTLVIEDGAAIPDRYHKVTVQIGWDDWAYLLHLVPAGPGRDRLVQGGVKQKEIDRTRVEEAIRGVSCSLEFSWFEDKMFA